jgi:hypothetical protein
MRRMRLSLETRLARARREGPVAPAPIAMAVGQVGVQRKIVPARGERVPVGEAAQRSELGPRALGGREGEAGRADGFGEVADTVRTAR